MVTLFIDYQQLVMQAYEGKKRNNTLPNGLMHLTPAKLKNECKMRCAQPLNRRDQKTIRAFCGEPDESKTLQAIIKHCETDKFRPLVNFLKGKSEKTDEKNIELLAWLIDFPDRPWEFNKSYPGEFAESPGTNEPEPESEKAIMESSHEAHQPSKTINAPAKDPAILEIPMAFTEMAGTDNKTGPHEKKRGRFTKSLAAAALISLALGTAATWWWKDTNHQQHLSGGCMYWKEDHYEPVACNEKVADVMVIALDSVKLKNFRRIMRPDTITYQSLGKVWYSKIDGKFEYYTSPGDHPVVFGRKLKPITIYIIDKYILSDVSVN